MATKAPAKPATIISTGIAPEVIKAFCSKIVSEGFVPAEVLRKEFGPALFTQLIALLYRTHRLLVERNDKWTDGKEVLGYKWADARFSQAAIKKLPPELMVVIQLFSKQGAPKYDNWRHIELRCRFTNRTLGAIPTDHEGGKINAFYRQNGPGSALLIPRYCIRAMMTAALQLIGKEMSLARKIRVAELQFPDTNLQRMTYPVLDPDGRTGLGMTHAEYLPSGTEFTIDALVPLSAIELHEFVEMLRLAGKYVGLSHGRSSGFGNFEVLTD